MRLLSVLWSSSHARKRGLRNAERGAMRATVLEAIHENSAFRAQMVESAGNAPASACLQGRCIACLPRPQGEIRNPNPEVTV